MIIENLSLFAKSSPDIVKCLIIGNQVLQGVLVRNNVSPWCSIKRAG